MAKGKNKKKKNWKLRRQLRKTLGCLFMVSAIIVTAIPVTPMSAADASGGYDTVTAPWCTSKTDTAHGGSIPTLTTNNKIYQNEDGTFQFAYVDPNGKDDVNSNKNKFAVIVGYNKKQATGGNLKIPNTIDAYVKYTDTGASSYAAASKNGKPLYYKETKKETVVVTDSQGNPVKDTIQTPNGPVEVEKTKEVEKFVAFRPCTVETMNIWCPDGITDIQLYYFNGNPEGIPNQDELEKEDNWDRVGTSTEDGRIDDAKVSYIGDQFASLNPQGDWEIKGDSTAAESVFGGTGEGMAAANIVNLTIGSNLLGIGDYAFYNCFNIQNITFADGLNTLGNYAFANCGNLVTATMPFNAMIDTLGDHAFYNCGKLKSFAMPTVTRVIGDSCFENCTSLESVDMIRKDAADGSMSANLKKIGYMAFKNCSSLKSLELPDSYHGAAKVDGTDNDLSKNEFHLSTVRGCTSLKYISTPSEKLDFVTDKAGSTPGAVDGSYGFSEFKAEVGEEFYFEAPGYVSSTNNTKKTPTHMTANIQQIAFKYMGEDKYEIVKPGKGTEVGGNQEINVGLVYAVDSAGSLLVFRIEDENGIPRPGSGKPGVAVKEITMPEKIGPYGIVTIAEGSFNDNCWFEKITVPGSVEYINANAFKGTHNLKHVIFTNAANIKNIGEDAFATQKIRTTAPTHATGGVKGDSCQKADDVIFAADNVPSLSFSGAIEKNDGKNTEPFIYAMKASSNINQGRQPLTYITYYSGIPTNLTVKYNPDTQMSELQGFATKKEVETGFKNPNYDPQKPENGEKYLYPYVNDTISAEAMGAFTAQTPTENQVALQNGVYNIVVPNGVHSIKEGLFSGLQKNGDILGKDTNPDEEKKKDEQYVYPSPSVDIKSITTKAVTAIDPYTFSKMPVLEKAFINGAQVLGDYAFDDAPALQAAEIGADTAVMGLRPFSRCKKLAEVSFPESPYFTYDNGIIYGLKDGAKEKIVQCLAGRGNVVGSGMVGPDELNGVKEIAPEAFMDCDDIGEVNLSTTSVKEIPERCFAECDVLYKVILPDGAKAIRKGAFWNTEFIKFVQIPSSVTSIAPQAFAYTVEEFFEDAYGENFVPDADHKKLEFICLPDSDAAWYAEDYSYIGTTTNDDMKTKWQVMFFDASKEDAGEWEIIADVLVTHGENVTPPTPPDHTAEGLEFDRWSPSENIFNPVTQQREILALYKPIGAKTYTVRFFDGEKKEMTEYTQQVVEGKNAVAPSKEEMEVEGKVFIGWDRDVTNVKSDIDTYAMYDDREPGTFVVTFWADDAMTQMIGKPQVVKAGEAAIEPAAPKREGYTFTGWFPSAGWENVTKDLDVIAMWREGTDPNDPNNPDNPGGNGDNNGNNGGGGSGNGGGSNNNDNSASGNSVSGNGTKYKVVVHGGSGTGEYTAGTIVPINAYAHADGTVFDKWTSSSNGVGFVNQTAVSTTFTMPANNVEITANFKKGSSSGSSVSSNSNRNTRRNSTTTVDITKSGISNKDLASANVNGSSDNYVVKITEDAQATAAVIAALEARYGDLSNIAYMPMDISLYDSTGNTKITDVSGITVDITLPLPDALVPYAGNNKAASVINNNQLEDLGTKFTTIDGVPCIQFTATHFSPYTIYVDKGNLTEGTIDATPKTGDPIHPKWFLAMGLACVSIILFCKKDRRQPKVKAV